MGTVFFHIRENGGFSFLPPFLSLLLFLAPQLLSGEAKNNSNINSLLQIRMGGGNVKNGVIKEIREVRFDLTGIARYSSPPPPPPKKYMRKSEQNRMKRFTKTPAASLAFFREKNAAKEVIRWKPRIMEGKGLALPDAFLSPDNSLLVFLETHGEASGPYATRLIFLNTHSWKVVFAKDYPQFYAVKGVFLEDRLLLYTRGQKYRDTSDAFVLLDPATGRILNKINVPFPVGRIATEGELLAVTEKDAPIVRFYSLSGESLVLKKEWKCASVNPALLFTPDGKKLLAAGKNFREEILLSNMRSWQKHNIQLPFAPAKIFMPGHGLYLFLPGTDSSGAEAQLLRNWVLTPIGGVSGGLALPGLEKNHFFLLQAKKGTFVDYLLPGCEAVKSFSAVELRPRTRGRVHFARTIPHAGAIAVMDSSGVFYLLFPDYAGKKYQKLILIQ